MVESGSTENFLGAEGPPLLLATRVTADSRENKIYREIGIDGPPRLVDSLLKESCDVRVQQARLRACDTNRSLVRVCLSANCAASSIGEGSLP